MIGKTEMTKEDFKTVHEALRVLQGLTGNRGDDVFVEQALAALRRLEDQLVPS